MEATDGCLLIVSQDIDIQQFYGLLEKKFTFFPKIVCTGQKNVVFLNPQRELVCIGINN